MTGYSITVKTDQRLQTTLKVTTEMQNKLVSMMLGFCSSAASKPIRHFYSEWIKTNHIYSDRTICQNSKAKQVVKFTNSQFFILLCLKGTVLKN